MMVEMSANVVGELLSALFKLGALQLRLGIIATEAMLTFGNTANQPTGALNKAMPSAISEEKIEAAARAITGRPIPQLPAGRRFRCTTLGGAAAPLIVRSALVWLWGARATAATIEFGLYVATKLAR
jgi:hypothetical protein